MYKYHNLVSRYSVEFQNAPQLMPLPAIPNLKDAFSNLIETNIRQSLGIPVNIFNYYVPEQPDYTIYTANAADDVLSHSVTCDAAEDFDVMGLSA